jgi:DNA-binding MarR family transcriptional regulator
MSKDLYEKLCSYYEFMLGPLPWRDEFKRALRDTLSEDELVVFFGIPFSGRATHTELAKKAKLPASRLQAILNRLAGEGLIMAYTREGQRVYERGNPVFMTEQQVRKPEDTPRRGFLRSLL